MAEGGVVKPLGNYAKVQRANGLLYVAGTTARQADGTIAGVTTGAHGRRTPDVGAQTRFALQAIRDILRSEGADLEDCVDITVFLTDMATFAQFNTAYAEFFDRDPPTRTTVGVTALPHPDMAVELKAIALCASRN